MTSNSPHQTSQEIILERLMSGLQDDLQDVQHEMLAAIKQNEGRLLRAIDALPAWQTLERTDIEECFWFSHPDFAEDITLGPRFVVAAHNHLQKFVLSWFYENGQIEVLSLDDSEICAEFESARQLLAKSFIHWANDIISLNSTIQQQLDQLLDLAISQLEHQREIDIEALELLVQQGELDVGRDAREEIAQLWEDQRARANTLRQCWLAFEEILHESSLIAKQGIRELSQLYHRLQQNLEELFPSLTQTTTDDSYSPTLPMLSESKATLQPESQSLGEDYPPCVTNTHTSPNTASPAKITQEAPTIQYRKAPPSEPEKASQHHDSFDNQTDISAASKSGQNRSDLSLQSFEAHAFRVLTRWQKVRFIKLSLVLGAPIFALSAMFVLGVLFLLDLYANPFDLSPLVPYILGISYLWLVVGPLLAGWHIHWRGIRPTVVSLQSIDEEILLGVHDDRFFLDTASWPIKTIRPPAYFRWESPEDRLWGWLLSTKLPTKETMTLTTWEDDREIWESAPLPRVDVPEQAWQIEPDIYQRIKNAFNHTKK